MGRAARFCKLKLRTTASSNATRRRAESCVSLYLRGCRFGFVGRGADEAARVGYSSGVGNQQALEQAEPHGAAAAPVAATIEAAYAEGATPPLAASAAVGHDGLLGGALGGGVADAAPPFSCGAPPISVKTSPAASALSSGVDPLSLDIF